MYREPFENVYIKHHAAVSNAAVAQKAKSPPNTAAKYKTVELQLHFIPQMDSARLPLLASCVCVCVADFAGMGIGNKCGSKVTADLTNMATSATASGCRAREDCATHLLISAGETVRLLIMSVSELAPSVSRFPTKQSARSEQVSLAFCSRGFSR